MTIYNKTWFEVEDIFSSTFFSSFSMKRVYFSRWRLIIGPQGVQTLDDIIVARIEALGERMMEVTMAQDTWPIR
jgi:hypothetical protein